MTQTKITSYGTLDEPHIINPDTQPTERIFHGEIPAEIIEPLARYVSGVTDSVFCVIKPDGVSFVTRKTTIPTQSTYAEASIPEHFWDEYDFDTEIKYIGGIVSKNALYNAFTGDSTDTTTVTINGPIATAEELDNPFEDTGIPETTTTHDAETGIIDTLRVGDVKTSILRDPPGEPMDITLAHNDTVVLNEAYSLKKWLQKHGDTATEPRLLFGASTTYNRETDREDLLTVTEFDADTKEATEHTYTTTGGRHSDADTIDYMNITNPSPLPLETRNHIPEEHMKANKISWGYYNYETFASIFKNVLKNTLTDTEITLEFSPQYPITVKHSIAKADRKPLEATFTTHIAPMIT